MKNFDAGIEQVIKTLHTDSKLVSRGEQVCSCVTFTTKEPDPKCKKCLGLGRNITIRPVKMAIRTAEGSFQNMGVNEKAVAHQGYALWRHGKHMSKDDLIVEGNDVYKVIKRADKRSDQIEPVYSVVYLVEKKEHKKIFLSLYDEVMQS